MSRFAVGLLPVAVGAADVALFYLQLDAFERYSHASGFADVELFVPEMVELKDYGIGLATIHAGVVEQIGIYPPSDPISHIAGMGFGLGFDGIFISFVITTLGFLLFDRIAACHEHGI